MFTWYISLSLLHIAAGAVYAIIALSNQNGSETKHMVDRSVQQPSNHSDRGALPFWIRF